MAAYAEAAARTDAVIAGTPDLGQAVPVPRGLPWFPQEVGERSVRWVLLHLIEETARRPRRRHPREHRRRDPLLAAAEAWPDPWFQPWAPASPGIGGQPAPMD
ncbi:mycothiol transferase [Streptomyces lateritius]|uniref:mycothiol transferase n=1 Tax=Streptomyces lateritius TaxID=67313 RepID=UPI003570C368